MSILKSKRNNLYIASVLPCVPDLNSIVLALATPIWYPRVVVVLPGAVADASPLVPVKSVYNSISLYGVVSPEISPISGEPYTFVMFTKLPTLNVDTPALTVLKALALWNVILVGAIFSTSYPLT